MDISQKIATKEKVSFGMAGFGQNMIYALQATFLMIFYTDVFSIEAKIVGLMFGIAKIWDAINDILMGTIVDNTRTKWGKMRPYLLIAPLPIMILTILLFTSFDASITIKIIYIYVTYILWGMIYTIGDVPYWGLSSAMSQDTEERTKLISFTRIMTMIGTGLVIVATPLLVKAFGGTDQQQGYLLTAITIAVIGSILFLLAFFNTKERVHPSKDKTTVKENLSLLSKNTPLLIILAASMLGFTRFSAQVAGTYVAKYNLGDENLFSVLGAVLIVSMIIAMALTPMLTKRFSKKKVFIGTSLFGGVTYTLMYFLGYQNFTLFVVMLFITSLSMGFFNVLQTAMIADSVDYMEWKTGRRSEGLCFAGQTFFFKISGALTNVVMGFALSLSGYVENVAQNNTTLNVIYGFVTILPAIGCFLSVIPMFAFKFTEDKQKECILAIEARKRSSSYEA